MPIAGSAERFPVRHIYCVGRNYAEHAKEMGGDATKEPPFFFTKAADAVVPVVPPAVGRIRYPLATKNLPSRDRARRRDRRARRQARARAARWRRRLRLCGRARHDAPRPAERHAREEAAVGHRQVVRAGGADRADPSRRRGRASGARHDLARRQRRAPADGRSRRHDLGRPAHDRVPVAVLRAPAGRSHLHGNARGRGRGRRRAIASTAASTASARSPSTIAPPTPEIRDDRLHAGIRRARLQQSRRGSRSSALARALRRRPRPTARAALAPELDLRYGPGPKETLDLFLPAGRAARHVRVPARRLLARARQERLLVRRARRSSRRGSRSRSSTTTSVPTCRIATIVDEMPARDRRGSRAKARRTAPTSSASSSAAHSAGGHLVAMLFATDWAAHGSRARPARRRRVALRRPRSRADGAVLVQRRLQARRRRGRAAVARRICAPRSTAPLLLAVRRRRDLRVRPPDAAPVGRVARESAARATARRCFVPARNHFNVVADYADPGSELVRRNARAVLTAGGPAPRRIPARLLTTDPRSFRLPIN